MRTWNFVSAGALFASLVAGAPREAAAQPSPAMVEAASHRFPQPVRAGDLVGRAVLEPVEAQPILGRVVALVRRVDGGADMLIRTGGTFGVGGRVVAVPIEAVALLGEYVALVGYAPAAFAGLPEAVAGEALGGDVVVRVGIVRPFH